MIKAEHLRIGNKVASEDRIYTVTLDILRIIFDGTAFVDGIPLTPEILDEVDGFERKIYGIWYYHKLKFDFNSIDKCRFHFSGKVVYIDHVHELQNLIFSLTNTELTINI